MSHLGGRLPLLDADTLNAEQRELFADLPARVVPWADAAGFRGTTGDGRLIGPFNAALRSPTVAAAFLQLQACEERQTSLPDRVRQVVILAVGAAWSSEYEVYAHSTRHLSTSHRVDDATFAQARKAFGERGITDMIILAGSYYTVCGLLNAFEVPAPNEKIN